MFLIQFYSHLIYVVSPLISLKSILGDFLKVFLKKIKKFSSKYRLLPPVTFSICFDFFHSFLKSLELLGFLLILDKIWWKLQIG